MAKKLRLTMVIDADGKAAVTALRRVGDSASSAGKSIRSSGEAAGTTSSQFAGLTRSALKLGGAYFGLSAIKDAAAAMISATSEVGRMDSILLGAVGSQEAFIDSLGFLRAKTDEYGISLKGVQQPYAQFAASGMAAGLSLDSVNAAFEGVLVSAAKFQFSTAELEGALLGLQQMAGSTNVSLEDLRQVTDRIPGGMKAAVEAAKQLTGQADLTTGAFKQLVSDGLLPATEFIPRFSAELQAMNLAGAEAQMGSLQAETNRLSNVMAELARNIGEAGLLNALSGVVSLTADAAEAFRLMAFEGDSLSTAIAKVQDSIAKDTALGRLGHQIGVLKAEITATRDALDGNNDTLLEAMGKWLQSEQQQGNATGALRVRLSELVRELEQVEAEYAILYSEMEVATTVSYDLEDASTAAGGAMDRAARDAKAFGDELRRLQTSATNATLELQALRAGGLTALASMRAYNAEAALFEQYADQDAEALNTLLFQFQQEQAALKTLEQEENAAIQAARDAAKARTSAARSAGAATRDEADEIARLRQAYTDLVEDVNPAIAAANRHAEEIGKLQQAFTQGAISQAEFTEGVALSQQRLDAARESAREFYEGLVASTDPAIAAALDYRDALAELQADLDQGNITQMEFATGQAILARRAKEASGEFIDVWGSALDTLDDAAKGLWSDFVKNGEVALDSLRDTLLDWLADMAYELLKQQLTVNITAKTSGISAVTSGVSGGSGTSLLGGVASGITKTVGTGVATGLEALGASTGVATGWGAAISTALPYVGIAAAVASVFSDSLGIGKGTDPYARFYVDSGEIRGAGGAKIENIDQINDSVRTLNVALDELGEILGGEAEAARLGYSPGFSSSMDPEDIEGYLETTFRDILDTMLGEVSGGLGALVSEIDTTDLSSAIAQIGALVTTLQTAATDLAGTDVGQLMGIDSAEQGLDQLALFIQGLRLANEAAGDTINRLTAQTTQLARAAELTATDLDTLGSQAILGIGQNLAAAAGGVDALSTQLDTYYSRFYDDEERRARTIQAANADISASLDAFGVTVPQTREEFRHLVDSLDLSHQGAAELFTVLMSLGSAFDTVYTAAEEALEQQRTAVQGYVDALLSVQAALDGTRQSIEEFGLTEEAVYARRKEDADTLMDALGSMTDAGQIEATVKEINDLMQSGWGLLDEGQKAAMQQSVLAYLDEVELLAEERLAIGAAENLGSGDYSLEGSLADFATSMQQLDGSFASSGTQFTTASAEMVTAAREMMAAAAAMRESAQGLPGTIDVRVTASELG